MSEARAKVLDYSIAMDRRFRASADGGKAEKLPRNFAPEHLVLAGLARCTLASLAYHAARVGITVKSSSAGATGRVTKRASDGRYAFVELECRLDVELRPAPDPESQQTLLEKAERDCFVGASLVAPTSYAWTVNGKEAA
ncbi:MAG TPA: OsmC family protein [Gaiellaceae bacterium]|nr:OsmC family protein [Gaiellaceae bacterium]